MRIFISHRRDDSGYAARRLFEGLSERFPGEVFMDIDHAGSGVGLIGVVEHAVGSCDVLLAVIGERWLSMTDGRANRRLDDLNDLVRLEIEAALTWEVPVMIVLFEGAVAPAADDLPDSLRSLAGSHTTGLGYMRWDEDVDRLVDALMGVDTGGSAARAPDLESAIWGQQLPPTEYPVPRPDAEARSPTGAAPPAGSDGRAATVRRIPRIAWLAGAAVLLAAAIAAGVLTLVSRHPTEKATGNGLPVGWSVHRDQPNGFSIAVPNGWEDVTRLVQERSGPVKFAAGDVTANMNVVVEPIPNGTDLQSYTDANLRSLSRFGAKRIRTEYEVLPAGEAMSVTYRTTGRIAAGTKGGTQSQYYLVRGARGYVVTFTPEPGSSLDAGLWHQIIETFRLFD